MLATAAGACVLWAAPSSASSASVSRSSLTLRSGGAICRPISGFCAAGKHHRVAAVPAHAQRRPGTPHGGHVRKPQHPKAQQRDGGADVEDLFDEDDLGGFSVPPSVGLGGGGAQTFLTLEEAGLVEMAQIGMHEKFLARLTVSSLNLLRVIAKDEGCSIEDLNVGKVLDWMTKDAERRAANSDDAVLNW
eukprot:jgi/Chlat1/5610/Chrsp369S05380